ncbi:ras-related protein rab-24 [Anaeramoeba flamelloides]|uniref:Ras-related protein rab-24 n=1 Tax=Anaeramoeba flamelloides TaxID=1746091 RepID=A0AAV7YIJ6_9EUKA|nr:ras-related protein rab-24 [Anaeramoeba flamelloides]KAJ6245417.1 ras-related protein rab-24 [Anaeramoeba flamelloides]
MTQQSVDFKILLLGNSFVGKSSIFNRYINGRFDGSTKATIGVSFAIKSIKVNEKKIQMGVWDTAGQEKFESITKMYYRNAKAAILCYDLTVKASFDKIQYWIDEIRNNESNCLVYLTGTKVDLVTDENIERVPKETIENYAKKLEVKTFETSAKNNIGIDELFMEIAKDYLENIVVNNSSDSETLKDINPDYEIDEFDVPKQNGCC